MSPVVILAYNYPPDNFPGSARPARFARYLPQHGYEPHVVTAAPAHGVPNVYPVADPQPLLSRRLWRLANDFSYTGWIGPAVDAASRVIEATGAPVILSTFPPAATHLAALILKRRHGVRWVADFRDPMAGSPVRKRIANRLLDAPLQRKIFETADAVIANTDAVAAMWGRQYPQLREKFSVIWNGYDPVDRVTPPPPPRNGRKVIAHVGHIYGDRNPGLLLEALSRLEQEGQVQRGSVLVRCLGTALHELPNPAYFSRFATAGLAEFLPRAPRAAAHQTMVDSDYLLLLDVNAGTESMQLPSKLFDYAHMRRPILTVTNRNSPLDRVLAQSGLAGSIMYWESPAAEQQAVLHAFLQKSFDSASGPSEWYRNSFDGAKQVATLAALIDRVCNRTLRKTAAVGAGR